MVHDGAIGLTTQRIRVNPQRFQRRCIKCLYCTTRKSYKNHAVSISRRVDAKAGFATHGSCCQDFTGVFIHAVDFLTGVNVQITIYYDGWAAGILVETIADLVCPVQHCVVAADRSRCIDYAIVVIIRPQVRPFRGEVYQRGIFSRLLQRQL